VVLVFLVTRSGIEPPTQGFSVLFPINNLFLDVFGGGTRIQLPYKRAWILILDTHRKLIEDEKQALVLSKHMILLNIFEMPKL